ncbi:shikimate dehydrogenase [Dehalococcoidia bacterium]|nr:shikimate dehydrogenase [Dehalococcoidia bacterium]
MGILGYPLGHSISPAFHTAAFHHYGLDTRYEAWQTPPEALAASVACLREVGYLGASVTLPHKVAVCDLVDELDPWAYAIGSVNTIVNQEGSLIGFNTDAYGFIESLRAEAEFEARGKSAVLIGAGGASRAAARGLAREGVASLVIANRTLSPPPALACELRDSVAEVLALRLVSSDLRDRLATADLIVNATSVGMQGGPSEGRSPLEEDTISPNCVVLDMVYIPETTPLLEMAGHSGARIVSGLPMLIYQGAAAFEHWTGKDAPIEVMFAAARRALADHVV